MLKTTTKKSLLQGNKNATALKNQFKKSIIEKRNV